MTTPLINAIDRQLPTIKQLQCFLAVCHELNFRKASERLNMTQPPLTRQIQSLEALLGQSLFLRNTHEVTLTEAGQTLLDKVEPLLTALADTLQSVSVSNSVKIGCTRFLNVENIPCIFDKLQALPYQTDSINENLTSQQLLSQLVKGKLDIVLIGEKAVINDDIRYAHIHQEPLLLVLPTSHSASVNENVSLEEVADLPLYWFARNENPAYYDKCEQYFRTLPFELKKINEPKESIMLFDKIAKGRGMALMPKSVSTFQQTGCCWKALSDIDNQHLNIDIYIAIRKQEDNPAILAIFESFTLPS